MWFGLHVVDSPRKVVRKRTARERPFFHPSSMNPILQRTLINLTAIKEGEWLLDPFCGTGGSLIEAALLGFKSVGIEIDRRIIWGAYKNLRSDLTSSPFTYLIMGDAKRLGFNELCLSSRKIKQLAKLKMNILGGFMRKECNNLLDFWQKLPNRRTY